MSKFSKINVAKIVLRHYRTLQNSNTHKHGADDLITFLWAPLTVGTVFGILVGKISDNNINLVVTALSIFVGLLINVLVLIFSIIQKGESDNYKVDLLQETITNISYTILVSILTILICFLYSVIEICLFQKITCGLIIALSAHFLLTLLMIVKRMYVIFFDELED